MSSAPITSLLGSNKLAACAGTTLATGPRGGGRSLEGIVAHVMQADAGYLSAVGWKAPGRTVRCGGSRGIPCP